LQSHMDNLAISHEENHQARLADAAATQASLQRRILELEGILQEIAAQHKQTVDALQEKLQEEINRNTVGKEERVKLVEQLEQMSVKLKAFEVEKDTASQEVAKLKEQVHNLTKPKLELEAAPESVAPSSEVLQQQPKQSARPPGASIPQTIPPYLPRPADAPRRAFGQGVVNPQDASVPADREARIANVTMKQQHSMKNATSLNRAGDVNTTLPVRKVPVLRGFRKFLSKRTGLHGVITRPSSSSSSSGSKRKRDESSLSSVLESPIVVGNHTVTNSTRQTKVTTANHPSGIVTAASSSRNNDRPPPPGTAQPPHR
jgi:hypothetical protein